MNQHFASAAMTPLVLSTLLILACTGLVAASICTDCHSELTPEIVQDFQSGAMGDDFDCSRCHGSAHNSADTVDLVTMPTHETCGACHVEQDAQYMDGKHSLAWTAFLVMPTTKDQPKELMEGQKGCGGCHKIGAKDDTGWDEYHYGVVGCDNCHTRHSFSVEEARRPEACMTCHQGFDHAQWEMYSTSKHGAIYLTEGDDWDWSAPLSEAKASYTGPTCQMCHLSDGDHAVITSWGFLGVRVEEPNEEWADDRATVLKSYGVLDADGNPTARFDLIGPAKLARLTMAEWNAPREEMIAVCSDCHSEKFARISLEEGDRMLREADRVYAESVETVAALHRDGILPEPDYIEELPSYPYPDVLRFYDQSHTIEEDLWVMWMKYRMRCFQSAFHTNADQEQWYGWGPLKETAVKIKSEDRSLRAEAEIAEAVGAEGTKEKTGTTATAEDAAGAAGAAESPGFGAALMVAAFVALLVLLRRKG